MGIYQLTDRIIDPGKYPWGVGPLWTPAEITTALWLDAADSSTITEVSGAVSRWADKSGNDRHAVPPSTRPTYTASGINSMGCIAFGSTQSVLQTPSFANPSGADGLLLACVFIKTGGPVDYSIPLCKGAVNAEWSIVLPNSTVPPIKHPSKVILRNIANISFVEAVSTNDFPSNSARVFSGFIANAGIKQYISGTQDGSYGASTISFLGPSVLTIGASPTNGTNFQGQLGEIVVVHADITDATRQLLEGYLAHKWGLTANLPSDHPYKQYAPRA